MHYSDEAIISLQDLPLDEFHSQLLSKAVDLFPSLTEEDLKPYLLRSRATSAYDAVTLLAQSVGVTFRQAGGSKCNNISRIQTAFENIFMVSSHLSNTLCLRIQALATWHGVVMFPAYLEACMLLKLYNYTLICTLYRPHLTSSLP